MNKVLVTILFFLFAATCFWLRQIKYVQKTNSPAFENAKFYHSSAYMNKESYPGLLQSELPEAISGKVYAGVVSHHFLAEVEISKFFLKLREQKVKTVVLVGPNHFNWGNAQVLTSKLGFNTPWGVLEPNLELIKELQLGKFVEVEEKPFETEHSISTLTGFIKHTWPEANFMPLIINRNVSLSKVLKLTSKLQSLVSEETLILASVDFSHHFNLETTERNDQASLKTLHEMDIKSLTKREVDSPQALAVVLGFAKAKPNFNFIFTNTNSARLTNFLDSQDVTSYVFGYFLEKEN